MFTQQLNRVAGLIMLVLVIVLIVASFSAQTPDTSVDDFPSDFQKVVDDEGLYLLGQAMQILAGVFVALLGVALYVLFRVRDRFLSLVGLTGFLLMSALFATSAAAYVTVHDLAQDLDRGETLAGEAEVQEIGRTLTSVGDGMFFLALIFFAIGLLGFGATVARRRGGMAPAEAGAGAAEAGLNPPAWLGWLAVVAGVLYLVGWLVIVVDIFFVAIIVAFILTILWYLTFGIWLLRSSPQPAQG